MNTLSADELAEIAAIQPPDGFALPWHVESKGQTMKSDIYSITLFPKGMAAFITNCVNALPRLLAAITEQRAEIERLQSAMKAGGDTIAELVTAGDSADAEIARLRGLIGTVREPLVKVKGETFEGQSVYECQWCRSKGVGQGPGFPHIQCRWPLFEAGQKMRQADVTP